MSDIEDDELLLQVAGRSKPPARSLSRKRKRRSISISEDDDQDTDASEEGALDEDFEEAMAQRSRGPSEKGKKVQKAQEDKEQVDSDGEFDDGYGSDLMGDDEDRMNLSAMNELDREMILAERADARDAARERQRAEKSLKQAQEQQQRAAEKAAPTRASTRAKAASRASAQIAQQGAAQIAAAKADKEEKLQRRRQRFNAESDGEDDYSESEKSRSARSTPERSSYEERQARSDSDDDDSDDGGQFQELDEAEAIGLEDAHKMQVKRHMLEKWINEPFFEATLTGCMVRVSAYQAKASGYVAAEVTGVEERPPGKYRDPGFSFESPYKLPNGQETSKWLLLQVGTSPRTMPIALISNTSISESEWRHWKDQCNADNKPQLNTHDCDSALERIKKASTYTYTAEDVQKIIQEKQAKGLSRRNVAAERARLTTLRDEAEENKNFDALEQLEAQLEALGQQGQVKPPRKDQRDMARVNRLNKARNFQNAFQNVGARPEGARTADDGVDPFSRRKTRLVNYWTTNKQKGAGAGGAPGLSVSTSKTADGEGDYPETPAVAASTTENEEGGLDLNIDMSALDVVTSKEFAQQQVFGQKWMVQLVPKRPPSVKPDRILSLAEYRRRLANIVG